STAGFTFTLNRGGDNLPNTADDIVSGVNGSGITSQRTAGPDAAFGTIDDAQVSFVAASIGKAGAVGAPTEVAPAIDVYHLNNHQPVAPGTRVRATLQLTELGSNLGISSDPRLLDLRSDVHFGVFETSSAVGLGDALLYADSSDIKAVGAQGQRT